MITSTPMPNILRAIDLPGQPGFVHQQLHLQRRPERRHRPVRRARRRHPVERRPTRSSRRYSYRTPTAASRRCSRIRSLSGDFSSEIFIRGQNARRRLVAHLRQPPMLTELRCSWNNRVRSDSVHPRVRHRRQIAVRHHRASRRIRASRRLAEHQSRTFSRLGGPFFRPQFQTSQVYQFAENLTWSNGQPHVQVRRRAAARPRHLHRPAVAQRRAVVPGRRYSGIGLADMLLGLGSLQRLTLFHQPDLLHEGIAVLRPGLVAGHRHGDGQLRHPLRVLHAAVRPQRAADQHPARPTAKWCRRRIPAASTSGA